MRYTQTPCKWRHSSKAVRSSSRRQPSVMDRDMTDASAACRTRQRTTCFQRIGEEDIIQSNVLITGLRGSRSEHPHVDRGSSARSQVSARLNLSRAKCVMAWRPSRTQTCASAISCLLLSFGPPVIAKARVIRSILAQQCSPATPVIAFRLPAITAPSIGRHHDGVQDPGLPT